MEEKKEWTVFKEKNSNCAPVSFVKRYVGYPGNKTVTDVFRELFVVFQFLQEDAGKENR